jgi:hypothetical protein
MDMLELVVRDVHKKEIPSWVFLGKWVFVYIEGDVAKEVGEMVCNVLFASWLKHNPIA